MTKKIIIFIFLFSIAFISKNHWDQTYINYNDNIRDEYSKFLSEHPYNNRNFKSLDEWKKIPKNDRPDLAMEQNILMTMDPKLKRVPYERLEAAYDAAELSRSSEASTFTWAERGPINVGGRTRALMYDPNDITNLKVWAGGVAGGLWFTNDITAITPTWNSVGDFWDNIAISCIAYDPNNTQIFYVGTGEGWYNSDATRGAGIWKTINGGATWSRLASTTGNDFYYVQKIVVHPTSSHVFAAVRGFYTNTGGILRSTDGGTTWVPTLNTTTAPTSSGTHRACDIEIGADNTIYAALGIFSTDGVYSSPDGAIGNWTKLNTGTNGFPTTNINRIEIATAPSNSNVLYAMVQGSGSTVTGIYQSVNKGATWTSKTIPTNADGSGNPIAKSQAWYNLILKVDPANQNIVYAGGVDLFKTTDGGSTWNQISHWYGGFGLPYVHADQHAIEFKPGSTSDILFGNDGGVHRTTNSGLTFSERNNGYDVTQFYSCAIHPTSGSNYFLAGTQDNGTQQFTIAGLNTTTEVTGGDGAFCFIDQTNSLNQITSYVYNNWRISTDGGSSFTYLNYGNIGLFINPADYDDDADILYSSWSSGQMARFPNFFGAGTPQSVNLGLGAYISHLRASPFTANTIFVGTQAGSIFKLTNAHATVTITDIDLSNQLPTGNISCIEIGANENQLLVTYSNYGITSVWETTDGGSSWNNKEGNLPDMPIRWALYNPLDRTEVMLATEVGVWTTADITAVSPVWVASNSGLANVRVDMMQIRNSDKMVIAATHGRGMFSLSSTLLPVELISFEGNATANNVELSWQTATEINNHGFEIERSIENKWEKIGFVDGHGNSNSTKVYNFIDKNPLGANKISYRLKQIDIDGVFEYSDEIEVDLIVDKFALYQNFPNPFNPTTKIKFQLPQSNNVSLKIYDVLGSEVATLIKSKLNAGLHEFEFNATGLASGTYLYSLETDGELLATKKMILLK